ncbi:phage terminase small subunit P27 family, partial [Xenorhabdus stockiae]|uniref:phage terminase small subunit P27 family n=1 Tax=Xenorhabdus stockiae TaxID=351614 RepID=UPI000C03D63F
KPEKGVPPIPKHFGKMGRYWHERIAGELDKVGVLTNLDAKALELLIEAYVEYRTHCDTLETEGYTYRTDQGLIKAHPAAGMKADAWKRIHAMLSAFGMSPSSRTKVNMVGEDKADPLAEFLQMRD